MPAKVPQQGEGPHLQLALSLLRCVQLLEVRCSCVLGVLHSQGSIAAVLEMCASLAWQGCICMPAANSQQLRMRLSVRVPGAGCQRCCRKGAAGAPAAAAGSRVPAAGTLHCRPTWTLGSWTALAGGPAGAASVAPRAPEPRSRAGVCWCQRGSPKTGQQACAGAASGMAQHHSLQCDGRTWHAGSTQPCLPQLRDELPVLGTQVLGFSAPGLQLCCQVPAPAPASSHCGCQAGHAHCCAPSMAPSCRATRPFCSRTSKARLQHRGSCPCCVMADTGAGGGQGRTCTRLCGTAPQQWQSAACPACRPDRPAAAVCDATGPPAPSLCTSMSLSQAGMPTSNLLAPVWQDANLLQLLPVCRSCGCSRSATVVLLGAHHDSLTASARCASASSRLMQRTFKCMAAACMREEKRGWGGGGALASSGMSF